MGTRELVLPVFPSKTLNCAAHNAMCQLKLYNAAIFETPWASLNGLTDRLRNSSIKG